MSPPNTGPSPDDLIIVSVDDHLVEPPHMFEGRLPARFADRVDTTQHDIIHKRRVELVAVLDRRQRLGGEIERCHFVQRSVGLAASTGAANGVVDKCLGHEIFSNGQIGTSLAITSFAQSAAS